MFRRPEHNPQHPPGTGSEQSRTTLREANLAQEQQSCFGPISSAKRDFTKEPRAPPGANQTRARTASRALRMPNSRLRATVLHALFYGASPPSHRIVISGGPLTSLHRHFLPVAVWTVGVLAAGDPLLPFPYFPPSSLPLPPSAAVDRGSQAPGLIPNPFLTSVSRDWPSFPVSRAIASVRAGAGGTAVEKKRRDDPGCPSRSPGSSPPWPWGRLRSPAPATRVLWLIWPSVASRLMAIS